ncbi:MAG: hypothetical protein M3M85_01440 [bacterium]|nr:hypothetical protein [bacterium]
MINLIPNQEKKKKVKDFYFRLGAVFIAALGFCVAVGAVSLMPTYFLVSSELNIAEQKLFVQQNQPPTQTDQNLAASVEDLDRKLALVESAEKNPYLISKSVIQAITIRKMPDIEITKFIYEKEGIGGRKIIILGEAPSRERLYQFRRALEGDVSFKKVELPISNFVKGSDIQFSLSLIPS